MRKNIFSVLVSVLFAMQSLFANAQTAQEKEMCQYSADHMIEIAKQSLSDKNSRPERIEKRRVLVEEWISRMEKGDDPCAVYADIQKSVTTF